MRIQVITGLVNGMKFMYDPGPIEELFNYRYCQTVNPGNDDIQEYTLAFHRGEEKGFNYFFTTLYPALLYYSFRITDDKYASEEIVGDSFIKIWQRYNAFNHAKVIRSWLYTTVRHASIDWVKSQQRTRSIERNFSSQAETCEMPVQYEIIHTEVLREIFNAIQVLPTRCQEVFKLLFIEGKTLRETAQLLGVSINTIKNQRARGLKLLKKRMPHLAMRNLFSMVA